MDYRSYQNYSDNSVNNIDNIGIINNTDNIDAIDNHNNWVDGFNNQDLVSYSNGKTISTNQYSVHNDYASQNPVVNNSIHQNLGDNDYVPQSLTRNNYIHQNPAVNNSVHRTPGDNDYFHQNSIIRQNGLADQNVAIPTGFVSNNGLVIDPASISNNNSGLVEQNSIHTMSINHQNSDNNDSVGNNLNRDQQLIHITLLLQNIQDIVNQLLDNNNNCN